MRILNRKILRKWSKRAPRIKTFIRPGCVICKRSQCIDEKIPCEVRITRSLSKLMNSNKDFVILEIYRCMPLLGDEQEKVPDWEVHIVRYSVVFVKYTTSN